MVDDVELLFPGLLGTAYRITSPSTDGYNCIAWAAGETGAWWWPGDPAVTFWPARAKREETLAAFREAFATIGYVPCDHAEAKSGFEKIALFADATGIPTHAARQLSTGLWTSKLGM